MIHIFDVDYTVIKKSSAWYFLREALNRGIIRLSQIRDLPVEWLRYRMGRPNMDFIEEAVTRIAGIDRDTLESLATVCFERRVKPNIYTGAMRLIREAQARGERTLFATSSFYTLIKPLEDFFGLDKSIASVLEFGDGKTTGRITGGSLFGEKKKSAALAWLAEQGLRPEDVRFYSDSYTDLPLLLCCGQPVAVNPDHILARAAKQRGWEILRFRDTLGTDP